MIVIDTNFIIHFYFPSDFSIITEKIFLKDTNWIAPTLWRSEFKNVIAGFLRREIIDFSKAMEIIERAELKMQGFEHPSPSLLVMELAHSSKCSSYDCEFIALAKSRALPLLTWDKEILKAFPTIAIRPDKYL
ncbi:MAG: type II toxin-antitoxin system VapC family toxin [Candidatus Riflebacteria bacterium]|nr:type II toxin-antitoxin system VapC family toxin [Candidatus Riflebacteria bacterium]